MQLSAFGCHVKYFICVYINISEVILMQHSDFCSCTGTYYLKRKTPSVSFLNFILSSGFKRFVWSIPTCIIDRECPLEATIYVLMQDNWTGQRHFHGVCPTTVAMPSCRRLTKSLCLRSEAGCSRLLWPVICGNRNETPPVEP